MIEANAPDIVKIIMNTDFAVDDIDGQLEIQYKIEDIINGTIITNNAMSVYVFLVNSSLIKLMLFSISLITGSFNSSGYFVLSIEDGIL